MAADVYFQSLEQKPGQELLPLDLGPCLARMVDRLGLAGAARKTSPWGLKVQLGERGHPPAVDPAWALAVARALAGPGATDPPRGSVCFDTLSITTSGLDQADTHLELAKAKGYGDGRGGLRYLVADGPDQGDSLVTDPVQDADLAGLTLAAALGNFAGMCLLTPVRPHPHAGFQGALISQGVGLADREGKLLLHRDIRPQVDTPLCAGCGSCLAVCLFDAISLTAGRAMIDHRKCTGCGECMNVCFMAGISPEEAAGIPRFQKKVAAAAVAAKAAVGKNKSPRFGYFNLLARLDRHAGRAQGRGRTRLGDVGVLAATDPVALDRATWDLIVSRSDGPLAVWSGFQQEPAALLDHAEELGLGSRDYRLVEF
ncbi:MAG: DUF362 domain-containing protein [Candidatus Krumholzibacteriota bacterium]